MKSFILLNLNFVKMKQNLFQKIRKLSLAASDKQKIVCEYVLSYPREVPFLTLADLAKKTKVSESTIVRFAQSLGYRGYPEMKKEWQKISSKS